MARQSNYLTLEFPLSIEHRRRFFSLIGRHDLTVLLYPSNNSSTSLHNSITQLSSYLSGRNIRSEFRHGDYLEFMNTLTADDLSFITSYCRLITFCHTE